MTVNSHALLTSDAMSKRQVSLYRSPGAQTVAKMKARQSAKIREVAEALASQGIVTLDAQAEALGLCRSTTWTIVKSSHKSTGLSATVISRILAAQQLSPLVRSKVLEYVEEKVVGRYGHSEKLRRKFVTLLLAKRLEKTRQVEPQIVKIAATFGRGIGNVRSAASISYSRPRPGMKVGTGRRVSEFSQGVMSGTGRKGWGDRSGPHQK
jgi:hypothetical protein